nr:MAG TPA: hypothetical protein [Caudoviricetes sp.]
MPTHSRQRFSLSYYRQIIKKISLPVNIITNCIYIYFFKFSCLIYNMK